MFIPEEKHQCHGIVEFIHLLEVGYLVKVAYVNDGEIFDSVGDAIENFVLAHA